MSALLPNPNEDYYLVSHGKNAALGSFRVETALRLCRGERVIVRGPRGLEIGDVLSMASVQQSRLIGDAGVIVRRFSSADEANLDSRRRLGEDVFRLARSLILRLGLDLEALDVDLPLEGEVVYLQVLARGDVEAESLAHELRHVFGLDLRIENLALGQEIGKEEAGCGKPDCGGGGGSCTSCSSGGCKTGCGSPDVDLRDYFAHLRGKMEEQHRVPLL